MPLSLLYLVFPFLLLLLYDVLSLVVVVATKIQKQ